MEPTPLGLDQDGQEIYEDYISVPPLLDNLPSSYTLITDEDFDITLKNYTQDYVLAQEQIANGTNPGETFNLYTYFN